MKKILLFFLAFVMVFTVVACNDGDNASDDLSSFESDISEKTESSDISEPKGYVEPKNVTEIKEMLTGDIDRTANRTNILKGLSYTYSKAPGSDGSYTDTENKLTNGIAVEGFDKVNWAGVVQYTTLNVDFDLGETTEGVADIVVGCLKHTVYGIGLPEYVSLYLSQDGENYVKAGTVNRPAELSAEQRYEYCFMLQNSADIRYIRIVFGPSDSAFLFLDEISAYIYDKNGTSETPATVNDYYDEYTITKTQPIYWDSSESDYNKQQNLALGKKIFVSSFASLPESRANSNDNSPSDTAYILTDGKFAGTPSWAAEETFRMTWGDGRSFIIDLEKVGAISSINIEFLAHTGWGVYMVREVGISASENGVDWQGIGTISGITHDTNKDNQAIRFKTDFEGTFKARYVKVSFTVQGHRALTEIQIMGTKAIPENAKTITTQGEDITKLSDRFITPEYFGGIENIMLAPICYSADGVVYDEFGMTTHDEYLPLVGYYENNILKDDFMDTFVFSPGGAYTKESDRIRLDGWKFYLDALYMEDYNLDALNKAAKTVGDGLGDEDFNVNIFLSIIRPHGFNAQGYVNSFGDIDGDGIDDPMDSLENRKQAMKWFVDEQLSRLEEAQLDKLKLVGFYWCEEVFFDEDFDMDYAAFEYIRDYVQGMGYKLFWIPYFDAYHYDEWKDYGFDMACLQPNYAFVYTQGADRLESAAAIASLYGMCVEIEISTYTNRVNIQRYKEYLEYGVKLGYMDAVKVYYHGYVPSDVTLAAQSSDLYTSSVYKDTYLFAKGLLDETYNQYDGKNQYNPDDIFVECNENSVKGKIEFDTTENYLLKLVVSPKFGTIELNPNGSYVYTPISGYEGEDYFCFVADFVNYITREVKVEITINNICCFRI